MSDSAVWAYARQVRRFMFVAVFAACSSSDSKPTPAAPPSATPPSAAPLSKPAAKPPDEMDEKMRHCPLALDGATSTLEDIEGGVRFTVQVPENQVEEARKRAHHVVDFAAKRTREGHGGFDAKGGGRMRNCPVVTDEVAISVADVPGGARLDITSTTNQADTLRAETRARVEKFPFVGATVKAGSR